MEIPPTSSVGPAQWAPYSEQSFKEQCISIQKAMDDFQKSPSSDQIESLHKAYLQLKQYATEHLKEAGCSQFLDKCKNWEETDVLIGQVFCQPTLNDGDKTSISNILSQSFEESMTMYNLFTV